MAPRETENNAYAKILGRQTKSIMVCYGIFWSGQLGDSLCAAVRCLFKST